MDWKVVYTLQVLSANLMPIIWMLFYTIGGQSWEKDIQILTSCRKSKMHTREESMKNFSGGLEYGEIIFILFRSHGELLQNFPFLIFLL